MYIPEISLKQTLFDSQALHLARPETKRGQRIGNINADVTTSLLRVRCIGDTTTINFQYIYHIAFWLLENSTTLQAPNK